MIPFNHGSFKGNFFEFLDFQFHLPDEFPIQFQLPAVPGEICIHVLTAYVQHIHILMPPGPVKHENQPFREVLPQC